MAQTFKSNDRYPASSRKQQIVETVLGLVAAHGTDAVSAQLIADTIGVTQPAVFRHFPSKEAIWLAVMDWLEERLVAIYSAADDLEKPGFVVLSRMFMDHARLIERYPALAKLVFSDHLRLQYPSLQERFRRIHEAYMGRVSALVDTAKADVTLTGPVTTRDAATTFLSLIQGLGFQFAIARLPISITTDAERVLAFYLQSIAASPDVANWALRVIEATKRRGIGKAT